MQEGATASAQGRAPKGSLLHSLVKSSIKLYSRTIGPFVPSPAKKMLRLAYRSSGLAEAERKSADDYLRRFFSSAGIAKSGDLVFDIGAHAGGHAQAHVALGARVVCLEPDPNILPVLHARFDRNPQVTIVESGVGDKEGELELHLGENTGNSTFSKEFQHYVEQSHHQNYGKTAKVPITTLDRLIEKYGVPKYCKIDTEGFEVSVLRGLSHKIEYISFEFHRHQMGEAKECARLICKLGTAKFNFTHYYPGSAAFPLPWMDSEALFKTLEGEKDETTDECGDQNFFMTGDIFARIS